MPLSPLARSRLYRTAAALALALPLAALGTPSQPGAEKLAEPPSSREKAAGPAPAEAAPVALVKPKVEHWPDQIEATGYIMPWQESHIGTEVGGLRLVSVLVNVGDVVKKGQVLARLNPSTVETELEAANAQLAEAKAALAQAEATLERANRLAPSGGVSRQELTLYETQKFTAEARLQAAQAQVKKQRLKLDFATLVAPDDGVISSRSAAEGAIVHAGSELFRLIRQGRLEWRAEVEGETLLRLSPGQEVTVKSPLGPEVKGRVRQVSPTIDLTTRNGLAYVDLPAEANLKAGLRVSGTLTMGRRKVLVLPAAAVLRQEGGARVFKVTPDGRIQAVEVKTGRERDGWVEITAGVDEQSQVVGNDVDLLKAASLGNGVKTARQMERKQ